MHCLAKGQSWLAQKRTLATRTNFETWPARRYVPHLAVSAHLAQEQASLARRAVALFSSVRCLFLRGEASERPAVRTGVASSAESSGASSAAKK
jgi:hypothetical protein